MSSTDHRVIVGQTGQNVLGLAIGAVATFAAQVLITNALGDEAFGVVTLTTQAVRTGVMSVNSSHSVHVEAPFGGFRKSGIGRELGMGAMELYTEVKNVFFSSG